jgi:hypothetical protein
LKWTFLIFQDNDFICHGNILVDLKLSPS